MANEKLTQLVAKLIDTCEHDSEFKKCWNDLLMYYCTTGRKLNIRTQVRLLVETIGEEETIEELTDLIDDFTL